MPSDDITLTTDWLQRAFSERSSSNASVHVQDSIHSTNAQLKDTANQSHNHFLIARQQTAGVGRQGGVWQSPPAGNLYLSYCFHMQRSFGELALVPLAVALEIADQLEASLGIVLAIKWPNDLYLEGKKCGGILLETKALENDHLALITGVGLNVQNHPSEHLLGRPVTSLQQHSTSPVSVAEVALSVMTALATTMRTTHASISANLLAGWAARDLLLDRPVSSATLGGSTGIARGIGLDGGLLVEFDGNVQTIYSGEVSFGHVGAGQDMIDRRLLDKTDNSR